jgi:3-hydroxyacyl-CoA dehydrogenase/enoyl-CoA hydratase/3-hydroxybutyryl-CoA epimerase
MEAVVLESEGVPGVLIDKAAKKFGMPMGPIELADIVGLDICLSVGKILAQTRDDIKIPGRIQQLVDSGHLGKKTGRGFYAHYKGRTIKPEIPTGFHEPADLAGRLVLRLLNECVACIRDEVVETTDFLDAGIVYGTGFAPFRGGPVQHIKNSGVEKQFKALSDLEIRHGKRFIADDGWQPLLNNKIS